LFRCELAFCKERGSGVRRKGLLREKEEGGLGGRKGGQSSGCTGRGRRAGSALNFR
jgi:hypothetical protein